MSDKTGDVSGLYVIRVVGTNIIKVGVSANPKKRMQFIQTGNHMELELLAETETRVDRLKIEELEIYIHENICKYENHVRGEWFHVNNKRLKRVIDHVKCAKY